MTDRDHFAAAALSGLLAASDANSWADDLWADDLCRTAYGWADSMLHQRGNQPEPPVSSPVTESMPKEKRAEVSDGSEPVAWGIERADSGSMMGFCHTKRDATRFTHAIIEVTGQEHFALRHVPLYRHKQPTLTDAAEESLLAMACYFDSRSDLQMQAWGSLLRGLLERLK